MAKQIFSILLCAVVLCPWLPPATAADYNNRTGVFDHLLGLVQGTSSIPLAGDAVQGIVGGAFGGVCSGSDDGLHHAKSFVGGTLQNRNGVNYARAICSYCGTEFEVYGADVSTAYTDYVETLPATGYNSAGRLMWQPSASAVTFTERYHNFLTNLMTVPFSSIPSDGIGFLETGNGLTGSVTGSGSTLTYIWIGFKGSFSVPVSGSYNRTLCPLYSCRYVLSDGTVHSVSGDTSSLSASSFTHISVGGKLEFDILAKPSGDQKEKPVSMEYEFYFPVYEVIPDTALSSAPYSPTTRPTSITGGNYGVVGDNNEITKVEDNSTIINETNNTYYNPATGSTVPITNWSYDYSDRSYKVTLESGDTATITYGDENISITETNTSSGDTVTNNYTIYYLVNAPEAHTDCTHDWQKSDATIPTCTLPGTATYVCSLCGETKTETIPALGHNWQVKQTVTTQYDETGQLAQQGYTIFECSVCHEQYKSEDGALPPGGGSGTDPGGEEGGSIWNKLGHLLGTVINSILDLFGTVVDTIFGGLIDLITKLFDSLKQFVDLFGVVGEAFSVLWTWLPPEITVILVAGVSIFVFVALLKLFMK